MYICNVEFQEDPLVDLNEVRTSSSDENEDRQIQDVPRNENHEIETDDFYENTEVERLSLNKRNDNNEFEEVSFVENCAVNNLVIGERPISIQTTKISQPRIISLEKVKKPVFTVNSPMEHETQTSNGKLHCKRTVLKHSPQFLAALKALLLFQKIRYFYLASDDLKRTYSASFLFFQKNFTIFSNPVRALSKMIPFHLFFGIVVLAPDPYKFSLTHFPMKNSRPTSFPMKNFRPGLLASIFFVT